MKPRKIIPIDFSPELLDQLDRHVVSVRASMPITADAPTITRSSLIRELVRQGLERCADYAREEARNAQAREQRAAGASV